MGLIRRAAEAAERTPDDRNRYADFLRVAAIGAVVLGHWLVIDIDVADGAPSGSSVLATLSWAHWATWAFQVIPAFFLVGGYANSASWRRHAADGGGWGSWLRRRAIRLLWPTAVFIAAGVLMAAIAETLGVPDRVLGEAAWAVAFILWFLAVYLGVTMLTPMWLGMWRSMGPYSVAVLIVGAALVDWVRFTGEVEVIANLNYAFVWGAFHQLGVAWRGGVLEPRSRAIALAASSAGVLVALVATGTYPPSMVTVPGVTVQNTAPPTVALLAYGLAQAGILLWLEAPFDRILRKPRVWKGVVVGNVAVMSIFLWHVVPVVVVAAILDAASVSLPSPVGSPAWYAFRPVWVLSLAAILLPIVALTARVERPPEVLDRLLAPSPPSVAGLAPAMIGAVLASAGLAWLAREGLWAAGGDAGPLIGLGAFALGCLLLVGSAGQSLIPGRRGHR